MSKNLRRLSALAIVAIGSVAAIRWTSAPWAAGLLVMGVSLLIVGAWSRPARTRVALINAGGLVLVLAAFETWLLVEQFYGDGTRLEGSINDDFYRADDDLGYAPKAGSRVSARKLHGDELIYDVVYSIDGHGLRVAPPIAEPTKGCIVFFGDSVTFGEGVGDEDTYPFRVGRKAQGRYAIYNFAFSGYGPHQMLANLQSGRVAATVRCQPTHFFYLALVEHVARVAGLTTWDRHGPRYRLQSGGRVLRAGQFDTPADSSGALHLSGWLRAAAAHSLAWQRFFGRGRDPGQDDLALFVAVVREAMVLSRKHHPESEFHVILWDGRTDERAAPVEEQLQAAGVAVHRVTSVVHDIRRNWRTYVLSEHDLHPNPRLHERLATYVVDGVLNARRK